MAKPLFILQGCSFATDGDGYYRESMPSRAMSRDGRVVVVDCHVHHRDFEIVARQADVLILFFVYGAELFPLIEERRRAGKPTIFETNDLYTDLPPWSLIAHYWDNPEVVYEHQALVRAVDAVQTSSARIAEHWRGIAKSTVVFANQLEDVPPLAPFDGSAPLTIGWCGSQGHLADFHWICRTLEPWLQAHPQISFAVMSGDNAFEQMHLPQSQYRYVNPGSIEEYYRFVSSLSIGLAPLLPTEYNRCRSDVKFLEYAAHGAVALLSTPGPYDHTVNHGETGFLCRSASDFIATLERVTSDAELRATVRRRAHEYVLGGRRITTAVSERIDFYRSFFKEGYEGSNLPECLGAASQDGNYIRVEADEISRDLYQLFAKQLPAEQLLPALEALSTRAPDHETVRFQLARTYNDLKQPQTSLAILRKLDRGGPVRIPVICEMARGELLNKNSSAARALAEKAIAASHFSVLGWKMLLRVMQQAPQADQHELLMRLHREHPDNLVLALLTVPLHLGAARCEYFEILHRRIESELDKRRRQGIRPLYIQVVEKCIAPLSDKQRVSAVLGQGCLLYPNSPKLLHLYGMSLRRIGQHEAADQVVAEALQIQRDAQAFRAEFRDGDPVTKVWQIPEQLSRALKMM